MDRSWRERLGNDWRGLGMSFEFPTRTLGEMVVNHDRRRVPIKASNRKPGPYPYYGAQGVVDHVHDFIFDGEFVLVAEDGENLRSRNEPVAQIANGKIWVNNHAHILQANELSNNWFLEAAINHSSLSSYVSGSTIPKLNKANLHKIPIPCPPKPMQDEIGAFLRSLADKIANNRALAADLEAMARAIFKSWFVDFDPVKAKMAGRAPVGMDADTASLFPDELVESELGLIPKGWEICSFSSIIDIWSGGTPKTKVEDYWDGGIPWFSVVDAPAKGEVFVIETDKTITQEGLNNSPTKILPIGSTIVSARGTVGRTAVVCGPMTMNQSCYALKGHLGDWFTYLGLSRQIDWLKHHAHGGVFDTITRSTFDGLLVCKPSEESAYKFEALVEPIFRRIEFLVRESADLAKLRDTLLPRLISGKLRLPCASTETESTPCEAHADV